mmetsp:Transcript_106213/g.226754  ORF Transcript_106213/g.226754 Transcript_106213/m.226754 type:complete len:264 (+) Transcript_106213:59-850(+)
MASPAPGPGDDWPTVANELALQGFRVGPFRIQVGVVLILLELLLLLLLLVIVREHGLVGVLIDARLTNGCARALGRQLRDDLRLLVPTDVLLEGLICPQLLARPPEVRLCVVQHVLHLGCSVQLFPVLELQACRVVGRKPMVTWIGNHHGAAHVVELRLACGPVNGPLLLYQHSRDRSLCLFCSSAHHVRDLRRRWATGPVAVLVGSRGLAIRIGVELSDLAQVVRDTPCLLGAHGAMLCKLLAAHGQPENLESEIVHLAELL